MNESVKERLKEFLSHKGIGQKKFAESCGLSAGFVNSIVNSIQPKTMERITMQYPELNPAWLLTGEGKMLKGNNEEISSSGVPHIESIDAFCGTGQGFDVSVMRKDCPVYNIPGAEEADFTIRAKGRSMINRAHPNRSIREGDYIACRKPRTNVIRYGEIYALATPDGVMVKVVQPCDKEGFLLLESFNTEEGYKPFEFPIVDIHDMAIVVAVASINRFV